MANVETADPATKRTWRSTIRWHTLTSSLGFLSWIVGFVALVLAGEIPWRDRWGSSESVRDVSGAWAARLALGPTTGRPKEVQVDVSKTLSVRWRGRGAMVDGYAWISDGRLLWAPNRTWRERGAREFEMPLNQAVNVKVSPLTGASSGLVVQTNGSEAWLWIRERSEVVRGSLLNVADP